ncbi:MAG: S24/S26 family peptidase [Prevotella sp.]|nr:S24/S26 family peptidase [Prevotella sp.]MDD7046816.1 S24/S26 family peptidase [Prevotella sp.]MDY5545803.1 S24/S26 family peptidase [Prevotella sp.]
MQQNHIHKTEVRFNNSEFLPEVVKMLNERHTVTLRLRGFSMRPFLEDGRDKALLTKPVTIKKGDAVLAEVTPGHYVLHRIISIKGENVVLRGDGNIGVERCSLADIKGFAIGFYRKGRTKLDRTNGLKWRVYSLVWTTLFPLRRYLLAFYRRIWLKMFKPL